MGTRDPRIDAYITKAAPFAQPILTHLREVVHAACPDVEETMKWSFPHFMYNGMLCGMAAFKQHCNFGFWKGALVLADEAAGVKEQFDCITSVKGLPSKKALTSYIRKAMQLNDDGISVPKAKPRGASRPVVVPPELAEALARHAEAAAAFESMSPSQRREYAEWIAGAKRAETKQTRVEKTIAQLSEGKALNWKYEAC
jgi:uncharacterized protein YdeI (YjbR/CyaY-like superfamily)